MGLQILVFREILNVRYNGTSVARDYIIFIIYIKYIISANKISEVKEKHLIGFRSLNWFFLWITLFHLYGKQVLWFISLKVKPIQALVRLHMGISFALYVIGTNNKQINK